MSLCNLKTALEYAEKGSYAIGAFDIAGEDMFYGVLDAAVKEKAPVIISVAEGHLEFLRLPALMRIMLRESEIAPVPVVLTLDHAQSMQVILECIRLGFTGIMFDCSHLSFEQNAANIRQLTDIAHLLDISVEGELGYVGGEPGEKNVPAPTDTRYTDPEQVIQFIQKTDVDALAVSIGTAHGLYKEEPKLNYELLSQIYEISNVPLVLHGGSGLSDQAFRDCIERGIRKINFYAGLAQAAVSKVREVLADNPSLINYPVINRSARLAVQEVAAYHIRLWGGSGKSWL